MPDMTPESRTLQGSAPFIEAPHLGSLRHRAPYRYTKFRSFNHSNHRLNDASNADRTALIAFSRSLWAELQQPPYVIAMPQTIYVVGHEPDERLMAEYVPHQPWEHKPGYYTIAEEVYGASLGESLVAADRSLIHEIDQLLAKLARYALAKLRTGGYFPTDLVDADQVLTGFMYGCTARRPAMRLYFVDQEPLFANATDVDDDGRWADSLVGLMAMNLTEAVLAVEALAATELTVARSATNRALQAVPARLRGYPLVIEGLDRLRLTSRERR